MRTLLAGVLALLATEALAGEPKPVLLLSNPVPALDEAALTAVRDWLFEPAMRNGLPVRGWAVVPIEFKLVD